MSYHLEVNKKKFFWYVFRFKRTMPCNSCDRGPSGPPTPLWQLKAIRRANGGALGRLRPSKRNWSYASETTQQQQLQQQTEASAPTQAPTPADPAPTLSE